MSEKLIEKLLHGKQLTGEEAGKLILYSDAKELELQLAGKEGKRVMPQVEMQACINSLNNEDTIIFNRYVSINNTIRYAYNTCLGHKEIAKCRLVAIETTIADIAGYTNRVRLFNRLPAIYTEAQLQDIFKEAEKEFRCWKYDITDMVCAFIGHQIDLYNKKEADDKFNKIMETYKKVAIPKDMQPLVLDIWQDYERYVIKDTPCTLKTNMDLINALRYRNIKPIRECPKKEMLMPLNYDFIKKTMSPKDIKEQITVETVTGEASKIHTLFDFLNNITFNDVNALKENDVSLKGILEAHFTELHKYALKKVVEIKGLERFKTDKEAEITLPELSRAGVLGYDVFYNTLIAKKYGYFNRGVAVLHTLWNVKPCDIDDKGYYKCSMDATTYDDLAELVHRVKENKTDNLSIFKDQINWPVIFNIIIDLMIKAYGIKELEAYKIQLADIEYVINNINERIKDLLLYKFMPIDMGMVTDADKKLYTIREEFLEAFPFIDYKFFEPKKQGLEATLAFIKDIKNFASLSPMLTPFYILFKHGDKTHDR